MLLESGIQDGSREIWSANLPLPTPYLGNTSSPAWIVSRLPSSYRFGLSSLSNDLWYREARISPGLQHRTKHSFGAARSSLSVMPQISAAASWLA